MIRALNHLIKAFGPSHSSVDEGRARLEFDLADTVVYAIGDVHGCMEPLRRLEALIAEDAAAFDRPKLIVMLGDYVDRGPRSAEVLDHLTKRPPDGFKRISLAGNHESAMLNFLEDPFGNLEWLDYGGIETIRSYGVDMPDECESRAELKYFVGEFLDCVPNTHRWFLKTTALSLVLDDYLFVHAGVRPGLSLAEQSARDLLWIRNEFVRSPVDIGYTVVHGHTPSEEPEWEGSRIGVDTGVYQTGRLTAVRLNAGPPTFLTSDRPALATAEVIDFGAVAGERLARRA